MSHWMRKRPARAGWISVLIAGGALLALTPLLWAEEVIFRRGVSPSTSYLAMYDTPVNPTATKSTKANPSVIYINYPTGTRLLCYFDVSAIPAGSAVSQATVEYNVYNGKNILANLGVYRVTTNWLADQSWSTRGGDWVDAQGTPQGAVPFHAVYANFSGWYSWDVTPIVQAWISGSAPNYGLIVVTGPGASSYGQAYGSGHSSTGVRPRLRVTYAPGGADATPPVISQVAAGDITDVVAAITWATDEPATSQVAYGDSPALGQLTPLNGSLVTAHSIGLTELQPGSRYYYQAISRDASNNEARSSVAEFVTAPPPDTVPPTGSITIMPAPLTNTRTVTLTLSAQDNAGLIPLMRLANDAGSLPTAPEEAFASSKSWELTAGDGPKTVYVQFKDEAGNWSASYSAGTTLDTIKPVLQILDPIDGAIIVAPN